MKIRICGKRVMKGNSKKTGNPYHFTEVHFLGSNPDVEGSTCETAIIRPRRYHGRQFVRP